MQETPTGPWLDCSQVARSIPGDCRAIGALAFQSQARCMLASQALASVQL